MSSRKFRSNSNAAGNLPRRTLVAISQADAAETKIVLELSAIRCRDRLLSWAGE
jgi:hypothetical protein